MKASFFSLLLSLLFCQLAFAQDYPSSLPDYSKSKAYSNIDYLHRTLKPNGKIDQILNDNPDERGLARALDLAERSETHIQSIKELDPSYPIDFFEARRTELIAKAKGEHHEARSNRLETEDVKQMLSEKQGYLSRIIINDQYSPYFFGSETNDINFIEGLALLDWKNTKDLLKKYLSEHPNEAYSFERLSQFEKAFEKQQNEFMLGAVTETIEWAYQREKFSKPEARKLANIALTIVNGALEILPDHQPTLDMKVKAEKVAAEFAPNYPSDFHKASVGKIVFSNKLIVHNKENRAAIQSSFGGSDDIYAMAYLDGGWSDYTYAKDEAEIQLYVNGRYYAAHEFNVGHLDGNDMFLDIELLPNPKTIRHEGPEKYAEGLLQVGSDQLEVKVVLVANYGYSIAEGSFTLDLSQDKEALKRRHVSYKSHNAASVLLSPSKMKNPSLEKKMVQAVEQSVMKMKPIKATIFDADWRVVRNTYTGEIMYRAIRGEFSAKGTDGTCKLYFCDFKQAYQGNGQYSDQVEVRQSLGSKTMNCDNVNKIGF